jgi:hypothetical protein
MSCRPLFVLLLVACGKGPAANTPDSGGGDASDANASDSVEVSDANAPGADAAIHACPSSCQKCIKVTVSDWWGMRDMDGSGGMPVPNVCWQDSLTEPNHYRFKPENNYNNYRMGRYEAVPGVHLTNGSSTVGWIHYDSSYGHPPGVDADALALAHQGWGATKGVEAMARRTSGGGCAGFASNADGWKKLQLDINGYTNLVDTWLAETHSCQYDSSGNQAQNNDFIDSWNYLASTDGRIRPQLVVLSGNGQNCSAAYDQICYACKKIGAGREISLTLETNNQQKLSYGMCMENMIDALNDCTTGGCP